MCYKVVVISKVACGNCWLMKPCIIDVIFGICLLSPCILKSTHSPNDYIAQLYDYIAKPRENILYYS